MAGMRIMEALMWCASCKPLIQCFRGDALPEDRTQAAYTSQFQIPPRRGSNYQGFNELSEEGLFKLRSTSAASSTQIQPELYADSLEENDGFTLDGPPFLGDRVKREEVGASHGTLVLTTKAHDDKQICLRFCDIRGLPDKGLTRSRSYWITARVTVGKCSKKCRAVRVNEQDATTSLNEELHFLGSAGDSLHIAVFEDSGKERPLDQTHVLGYCQVAFKRVTEGRNTNEGETLHTCFLTQAPVTTPTGQLLLSMSYENANLLTVAIVRTKGLPESIIKITLRCNGQKIKKGRVMGCGPIYNQSFKFLLPEQFISSSSVVISLLPGNRKLRRTGNRNACCISGPWMMFSNGRLTHWGEMLVLKKPVLQWRLLYPI
ncbi:uncharacterized protein LOC111243182 [Varroa destructor]|uniref:C2 domain-containing protein n=1 Tax=Varroa destructor TaxID=109461 RepID=A0A7M7J024_VARDE|nr:uncharacterized protein LOC111243182 [Varroa destructor]XP_022644110.1 uncharacterized protein LOC111243182 [Varroa destructor]